MTGNNSSVIRENGKIVGGLVLKIDEATRHNVLELLFVHPRAHSKGIGYSAWQEVERLYPETGEENNYEGENLDGMFRFEKQME